MGPFTKANPRRKHARHHGAMTALGAVERCFCRKREVPADQPNSR
jgi:hypothetical protein